MEISTVKNSTLTIVFVKLLIAHFWYNFNCVTTLSLWFYFQTKVLACGKWIENGTGEEKLLIRKLVNKIWVGHDFYIIWSGCSETLRITLKTPSRNWDQWLYFARWTFTLSFIEAVAGACNFIKKETLAQVFFCKFCKTFKNNFFYRKLSMAGSV